MLILHTELKTTVSTSQFSAFTVGRFHVNTSNFYTIICQACATPMAIDVWKNKRQAPEGLVLFDCVFVCRWLPLRKPLEMM